MRVEMAETRARGWLKWSVVALATAMTLAAAITAAVHYRKSLLHGAALWHSAPKAGETRYAWLSSALNECDRAAASHKGTLMFMIVPLAPTKAFSELMRSQALETVGPAMLFESKVAMDGLEKGLVRLSSAQFVLYTLDTKSNAARRWNSATGVSTLAASDNVSDGPYKVRLQTAPDEPPVWSTSTANGTDSCHWIFALFRR